MVEIRTGSTSLQWAKHAGLQSDPLEALKGELLSTLGSQHKGPSFHRPHYPTTGADIERKKERKKREREKRR